MPQIIVKNVKEEQMPALAQTLAPQLADIVSSPVEWFVFDLAESKFYNHTGKIPHYPVIQGWWYERPQEVNEGVADALAGDLRDIGYDECQISFHLFDYDSYFEY